MKTIFISALLVLCSFSATSQTATYHPYPETYGTWMFRLQWADGSGGLMTSYFRTVWSGDTTINAMNYRKTYRGGADLWVEPSGGMLYTGAVRQDVANQKLFYLDLNNVEHDISIDQFLEVGDTIPNTPNLSYALNMQEAYVDPLYATGFLVTDVSQEASGLSYRTLYRLEILVDNTASGMYVDYISGIGAGYIQLFEQASQLNCHSVNGSMVVGGGGAPDPYVQNCLAGVREHTWAFSISPNPATDHVVIHFSDELMETVTISIFDLGGKQVSVHPNYTFGSQLSVAGLQAGSYLLSFEMNGQPYTYPLQLVR